MASEHLLRMAADLVEATAGRPRRVDLCRAVSAACYALFHCPARACADSLAGHAGTVGNRPAARVPGAGAQAGQDHAARTCRPRFPTVRGRRTFGMLQGRRHLADYDPDHPFSKSNVITDINNARTATSARRDFAVLMKVRPDA